MEGAFTHDAFMPHGVCYLWNPGLIWLHVVSDTLIALAYLSIPITLAYFVKKRKDLPFNWMFLCFGIFIVACGATHIMEIWTLWAPYYWLSGMVKAVTALASVPTAVLLIRLIPTALQIPSQQDLKRANDALQSARNELELKVEERTTELRDSNAALKEEVQVRQRVEQFLRESNQALDALIQASPLPITVTDNDGQVSCWNPAAEAVFGWTEDEMLGQPVRTVPEDGQEEYRMQSSRVSQGELLNGLEVARCTRQGTRLTMSLWAAPLRDSRGNVKGSMTVLADLTERKRLEQELRQAQKMEAVGRLAGGVAHDFNNLLGVIVGYSESLLEKLSSSPWRAHLKAIHQAGEHGATLTRQLLAFSRKQVLDPKILRPNDVVEAVAQMLRRLIGEHIELTLDLDPQLGTIKADPGQIEQVIVNLVVNARDAMEDGGRIRMETRNVEADEFLRAENPALAAGRYVLLVVSDNGHGMDAETLSHVFEPFFTTKPDGKGTGLGLATVYGIVQQSGGHISVFSDPALGTTFKVYLPQVEGQAAPVETESAATLTGGSETVLLAEDDDSLRELTRELLQSAGYTVLAAVNGLEALLLAAQYENDIHLLVTDVVMPGIRGPELAKRLTLIRPNVRVLYVSGYTDLSHGEDILKEEGSGFLHKPFNRASLMNKIRGLLDG